MKFGTQMLAEGVRFRLWAPKLDHVRLHIDELGRFIPMQQRQRGWFEIEVPDARPGMRYGFLLPNGRMVPDPASRFLPDDVDGQSEIIDPQAFDWTDRGWKGRPWEETILYELHVGTFTQEGTYRAAIDRLDHLVSLGINTVELMPLGDFRGRWNWGYDGANLFAPDSTYGRPEDLKAFVNAAHGKGISVFLDVIYNHFGPKGNFINSYAPLMNEGVETPWGPAINYDGSDAKVIREMISANARYWLNEYHLDGLRFDAVHMIHDDGPRHFLIELSEAIRYSADGRHIHLVIENSNNEAGWLKRREDGSIWLYEAVWSDDIHHALHGVITGEPGAYYADFIGRTDLVGQSLAEGMGWQGEYMEHEERSKGEPSAFLPATAFVAYMQNHDQVGNRPHGDRISNLLPPEALRMWSSIVLLSPQIPLVFMGEEWMAGTPFLFFSDVGDDLAEAIRKTRKEELENYPEARHNNLPDPMSEEMFTSSKLDWSEVGAAEQAEMLAHYRALISVRKREIIPRLFGMQGHSGRYEVIGEKAVSVSWTLGDGSTLSLLANLGAEPVKAKSTAGRQLWLQGSVDKDTLGSWTALFTLG